MDTTPCGSLTFSEAILLINTVEGKIEALDAVTRFLNTKQHLFDERTATCLEKTADDYGINLRAMSFFQADDTGKSVNDILNDISDDICNGTAEPSKHMSYAKTYGKKSKNVDNTKELSAIQEDLCRYEKFVYRVINYLIHCGWYKSLFSTSYVIDKTNGSFFVSANVGKYCFMIPADINTMHRVMDTPFLHKLSVIDYHPCRTIQLDGYVAPIDVEKAISIVMNEFGVTFSDQIDDKHSWIAKCSRDRLLQDFLSRY